VRAEKLSDRVVQTVVEHAVEDDYRSSAQQVQLFGNTLSAATVGRLLQREGARLEQECFGLEAMLAAARQVHPNPPGLLIASGDGSRFRTHEADRPRRKGQGRARRTPADPTSALTDEERDRGGRENKVGVLIRAAPGHFQPDGTYVPPAEILKTYVATTGDIHLFGRYLHTEYERRGGLQSLVFVWVSDHGHGLPEMLAREFAGRITQIITDFFHVGERLMACARIVCGEGPAHDRARRQRWHGWRDRLWRGRVARVIDLLTVEAEKRAPRPTRLSDLADRPDAHTLWTHIFYLEKHQATMDYPTYRDHGWPMGSGVIESACGQFGDRFKHNRMRWTRRHADAGHHVKAAILSGDGRWSRRWPPPIPVLPLPLAS
jgi:hypothetical protein